ncbi:MULTISPECIES: hypothetical protein [unclassified Bradyrhizobium]|uniref:hypothetical protein n=1 Tax=unclassified Bradyrhizobium TaxID=2631580 RepID=UPI0028EF24C4|nr:MULTISPECIES: hypothetical protein [unclassified Bradyrhizobium]
MNIVPRFSGAAPADDRGILDVLRGSEMVRKAAAERDAAVTTFRATAAKKLAELDAAAGKLFPKLRAEREAAIKAAHAAERAWREACDRAQNAQNDLSRASHKHTAELQEVEAQLISTASPEIAIFLAEMDNEWDKALRAFAFHRSSEVTNMITGRREDRTVNNAASVEARKSAIRDAQEQARAMRLEPDQSTVPARLQELRANLPAVRGL